MDGTYTNPDYGTANPHSSDGSQSTNMNNPPAVIVNKSGTPGNYITPVSYTHLRAHGDRTRSRMPSSA